MTELLRYPFQLSGGGVAYLSLPPDLSEEDAERLCAMVRSLVQVPRKSERGDSVPSSQEASR